MADTSVQRRVEAWVRDHWLTDRFEQEFARRSIRLESGGEFQFGAVSADGQIVAAVSTSGARTSSGRLGSGKIHKLRSDMFFLLLANAQRRLLVVTEADMHKQMNKEIERGRVPRAIELLHAEVPGDMALRLAESRAVASREVMPR